MEVYNFLVRDSILMRHIPLLEWFSKSVRTCPAIVGKTVRWDILCFECGAVRIKNTDHWGGMVVSKRYDDIICGQCLGKHYAELKAKNAEIPQFEI